MFGKGDFYIIIEQVIGLVECFLIFVKCMFGQFYFYNRVIRSIGLKLQLEVNQGRQNGKYYKFLILNFRMFFEVRELYFLFYLDLSGCIDKECIFNFFVFFK